MAPAESLFPEARRAHAEAVTRSVRSPTGAISDAYRQRDADLDAWDLRRSTRFHAWRLVND